LKKKYAAKLKEIQSVKNTGVKGEVDRGSAC
jgi:hypothetical protein